jgi:hypothetical protein
VLVTRRVPRALVCALALVAALGHGRTAAADWFVIPAGGITFASGTNLIDLENAAGVTKVSLQGSVLWMSRGWLGIDGEVAYVAGFFERERQLVSDSSVLTAMGSVVVTVPLDVTRHSLRPYAIGGFGLIRANVDDVLNVLSFDEKLLGLRVGGGAMGFFSDTTGVRLDLSYIRTLKGQGNESGTAIGTSRSLHFWRGSAGIVLRF